MKILSISYVRRHMAEVIKKVKEDASTCFITKNGRGKAVLMSSDRYYGLMSLLEERDVH